MTPRDAEGDAKAGSGGAERRAFDLFALVCDLPREERGAVLDRECAGDAKLRAAVESLLAHDAEVRRAAGSTGEGDGAG
jgi:hypothetical protein